jgi:hypothetical protein
MMILPGTPCRAPTAGRAAGRGRKPTVGGILRALLVLMLASSADPAQELAPLSVDPPPPEGSKVRAWKRTRGFRVRACHTWNGIYVLPIMASVR